MNNKAFFDSCATCSSRQHSIFKKLQNNEAEFFDEVKACMHYKKGQVIFNENGFSHGLYCINAGKVKLTTSGINGKEQILRLLKDGDVIGYRTLLSNERYHCSAVAIEDTKICFIPKQTFFETLKNNSEVNFSLLELLSNNLKKAEDQIISLAQKNVRERVAEALLFFKATYGVDAQNNLNLNFSREEIADFVGTSTESVIRLLSEFNNDKIIKLNGKKIEIVDMKLLLKTANLD
jgi:CRP-like cAMP-binding protein